MFLVFDENMRLCLYILLRLPLYLFISKMGLIQLSFTVNLPVELLQTYFKVVPQLSQFRPLMP